MEGSGSRGQCSGPQLLSNGMGRHERLTPSTASRGQHVHVDAACLSVLGTTQPGRLSEYIRRAISGRRCGRWLFPTLRIAGLAGSKSGTGARLIASPTPQARKQHGPPLNRLAALDPDAIVAERDPFETVPFLRFDTDAQETIHGMARGSLEKKLRARRDAPGSESHLAKYRKLVPSLALLYHLADARHGPVSRVAVLGLLRWLNIWKAMHGAPMPQEAMPKPRRPGRSSRRVRRRDIEGEFTRPRRASARMVTPDLIAEQLQAGPQSALRSRLPRVPEHARPAGRPRTGLHRESEGAFT